MDEHLTSSPARTWWAGARPRVSVDEVTVTAQERWGLGEFVRELGSHQDRNFLFESAGGRVVVKIANRAWERSVLEAQTAALQRAAGSTVVVPTLVHAVTTARFGDQDHVAHVVSFIEGDSLFDRSALGVVECRAPGLAAGEMVRTLSGFSHPGAVRESEWDLRAAEAVLEEKDPTLREAVGSSLARVAALRSRMPLQVIHGDVTDSNVLMTPADEVAVIDFGDVGVSWRCGELAVAAACVLGKTDDDVAAVSAVVEAFAHRVRLTDAELSAVWPLMVVRTAVLLATGDDAEGEPNAYTRDREVFERAAFTAALALDAGEMSRLIRTAGARPLPPPGPTGG
jgi:Ser/Thr protein kinase RdoA (MazF antagonist)